MDKSRILEAIRNGSVDPFFSSLYHKDSPSPPATPDYAGAAQAQGQANVETARLQGRMNNPNIVTPYGSQTVTWGTGSPQFNQSAYDKAMQDYKLFSANPGGTITGYEQGPDADSQRPIYSSANSMAMPTREQFTTTGSGDQPTVTQTLSPAQQKLLDSQTQISQYLANIGTSELPRLQAGLAQPLDSGSAKAAVAKAYGDITSRLDPQWQEAGAQNETKLRNQGLTAGGEAYDSAMRNFNQGKNDAYTQANLAAMQYAPTTMQMDIAGRDQLLNELNALRSGSQVQNPQFQQYQGSQIGQTPIMQGAQQQAAWDQNMYNQQVGSANAFNQGLFSLGGAVAGKYSDRRLKSNIVKIGTHPLGIGIYEYDIFGHRTQGVMADEIQAVMPDAVIQSGSGYLMVDYGKL